MPMELRCEREVIKSKKIKNKKIKKNIYIERIYIAMRGRGVQSVSVSLCVCVCVRVCVCVFVCVCVRVHKGEILNLSDILSFLPKLFLSPYLPTAATNGRIY